MSGLVNKVKDAVSGHKHTENEPTTHSHSHTTTGTTGTTTGRTEGLGNTTGAPTYTEGTYTTHNEGPASRTDGPHKSDMMNKADPRVDSDRDYSKNMGINSARDATTDNKTIDPTANRSGLGSSTIGTTDTIGTTSGLHSTAGTTGHSTTGRTGGLTSGTTGYTENVPEGTFGPHGSRTANAADPRVDSDLDNTRTAGVHNTRSTGTTGLTSSGGLPEGSVGPHGNRTANAMDPRVDSDLDNTRTTGTHGTTGGLSSTTGHHTTGTTGTTGHHTTGTTGGLTGAYDSTGPGPAPNTAGPHKSDMMNKADPRVDSDLDGSKTYGGDKTYNTTSSSYAEKDPTDAAQVPPSVMQKHIGAPQMAHDDHSHQREKRHSVSHQEGHRGM